MATTRQTNTGSTGTGTAASITVSLPSATLSSGSTLFLLISTDFTMSTPSGWTLDRSQVNNNGHYHFRKAASGGENSWNVTLGNASAIAAWIVREARGLQSSPVDGVNSTGSGTAALTRATGSTPTTTNDNDLIAVSFGFLSAAGTTPPTVTSLASGTTVAAQIATSRTGGGNYNVGIAYAEFEVGVTAGWSDTATFSASVASTGIVVAYKEAIAVFDQEGFRWRNDDGDEDGATWAAAQDTNLTNPISEIKRLRMLVNNTAGDAGFGDQYQLEYRKVGDPTWEVVG